MSRPIHFDLSADNPQLAADFYRNVFGWKVEKWDGPTDYWMMTTGDEAGPGITGGISPADTTAVVFDVDSVDAVAQAVQASGGQIREPNHLCQLSTFLTHQGVAILVPSAPPLSPRLRPRFPACIGLLNQAAVSAILSPK